MTKYITKRSSQPALYSVGSTKGSHVRKEGKGENTCEDDKLAKVDTGITLKKSVSVLSRDSKTLVRKDCLVSSESSLSKKSAGCGPNLVLQRKKSTKGGRLNAVRHQLPGLFSDNERKNTRGAGGIRSSRFYSSLGDISLLTDENGVPHIDAVVGRMEEEICHREKVYYKLKASLDTDVDQYLETVLKNKLSGGGVQPLERSTDHKDLLVNRLLMHGVGIGVMKKAMLVLMSTPRRDMDISRAKYIDAILYSAETPGKLENVLQIFPDSPLARCVISLNATYTASNRHKQSVILSKSLKNVAVTNVKAAMRDGTVDVPLEAGRIRSDSETRRMSCPS
eukprot:CFRG6859T1